MNRMSDLIDRQAAIDAIGEKPFAGTADEYDYEQGLQNQWERDVVAIKMLQPTQPEDWMERNKERILQAGMEGREVEFWIGGRLFAIREKAQ